MDLLQRLANTVQFIQSVHPNRPQVGIVLGSGLGNFTQELADAVEIPYHDIPDFPVSTVEGHSGKLIFGIIEGVSVVVMAGRFHFYEGYAPSEVTYPIRVMKQLGIELLLLSNAAGGVQSGMSVGDLMIIRDHISFFTPNPLIGKNEQALGPRFPDMSEPYSKALIHTAKQIAAQNKIGLKEGVYCGVTGPTFETRAEYKLIQSLGGDAVGMSTVQEVIVARHMNLPVFAISVITDLGIREEENTITHQEVLEAAAAAEPQMALIFKKLIAHQKNL
jgi:purine-nucleoside phosphorylase